MWFALAAIVFVAWFAWQLFGPNAPIRISKETTFITEPLRPDGLPDYVSYLKQELSAGVTQKNNAAVLMWQAFGPGQDSDAIEPADWERIVQELQLPTVDPTECVVEPDNKELAESVEQWIIANDATWKEAFANPPAIQDGDALPTTLGYDAISMAQERPWQREQLPPLADWVDANSDAIDLLVAASARPRFYTPLPSPDDNESDTLLNRLPMDGMMRSRAIARILMTRAMLRLGEGRHADAWSDLYAIHRWARLVGQGPTLVEQLVAIAIDGIACSGDGALLSADDLSPEVAKQIQNDLRTLRSPSNLAECYNEGERIYFLDSVVSSSREGIGRFYADNFRWSLCAGEVDMPEWQIQVLNRVSADWNLGLVEGNRLFDRATAAARLPGYKDRQREFDNLTPGSHHSVFEPYIPWGWSDWAIGAVSVRRRNEMLTSAIIESISSTFQSVSEAEDRGNTMLALTQFAAALAVYRAERGEYPVQLEQLVPEILSELPVDLYHEKPFIYQRDGEVYLLYSTGPNGVDDGGSNSRYGSGILAGREIGWNEDDATEKLRQQIPEGADDLSIRLPRPPFKLPEPPSAQ
jgi:hypothetical protein